MNKKLIWSLLVGNLAFASVANAASDEQKKLSTTMHWKLSLDADGGVASLDPKGKSIDALREKLETAIRQWDFEPGQIEGKPAATITELAVEVELTESADGREYAVRIRNARTGGSVADASAAPRFPASSLTSLMRGAQGVVAQVIVEVRYDAAGMATAVTPLAGTPLQDGPFVDSVRKAVKRWTYQPERIAGIGVPGTVFVPVCFSVSAAASKAQLSTADCRWTQPGTQISVDAGDSLAAESKVQLKTQVNDRVL